MHSSNVEMGAVDLQSQVGIAVLVGRVLEQVESGREGKNATLVGLCPTAAQQGVPLERHDRLLTRLT